MPTRPRRLSAELRAARLAALPQVTYPDDLPVSQHREEILDALRHHQVVVVAGETGSGKTTQIPKMCLELGRGIDAMIGHTQPRRIAARTVAERLAEELGVELGGAVGYTVRFSDTVADTTLVKVMTDGILLAETRRDPLLSRYDTIVVDEAHERSLNIDFLLGYLTRLLPRRPDLTVVVTSATIDTARFAEHFGAPVVEVTGRSFPVEVRYRPLSVDDGAPEDRDLNHALCDAVRELVREGPGDVLVFLPGERDIRDAAEALRESGPEDVEILPLYARLSAAEQHRVFRPHATRRVVLATNVAETSLTVPGIRSVVDTGLARVSRYNRRTKVQRLPIERVSRASANQRAGRCGRVAAGTCIRLYSEQDYEDRPEFTDPEILRTNLASVVLQMAALGLGEIESFPFVEPPDRRSIADGRELLEEIGAFETRDGKLRLTAIGRRVAELPLDPRIARMVVEAERLGCLREVTIVAAALSVQDPRERPREHVEDADELHRRFAVPDSDFLGYVQLWDYLAHLQAELTGNQFRRRCRAEYLNVLRIREWQDVASQIRRSYRSRGTHASSAASRPREVHEALLSGLLGHVGRRDAVRGDYEGARGTRWQIGRSSQLARRKPAWAMAADLVETSGTWASTVGRVEPAWVEKAAAHLVRRSYSEPWWDPARAEAMVEESVTLYGLTLGRRPVSLARVDPATARRIFIEEALVGSDPAGGVPALERNWSRVRRVRALEDRTRRPNLYAGDSALADFYDRQLPADVTTGRRFERWWRATASSDPGCLDVPFGALLDPSAGTVDVALYPLEVVRGDLTLALAYRFAPGDVDDGVTVEVPLAALGHLSGDGFDWHVPGYRAELVAALVRTLPKAIRRSLVPLADTVEHLLGAISPDDGSLVEVLASQLSRISGSPVSARDFDLGAVPGYLRMSFVVTDDGRELARGQDLDELRRALRSEIRTLVAKVAPTLTRSGETSWCFGDVVPTVESGGVVGYPALTDESNGVGLAVLDSPEAQEESMWRGTRRLLLLSVPVPAGHVERRVGTALALAVARAGRALGELVTDCAIAVADELIAEHGGPSYTEEGFTTLLGAARRELVERVASTTARAARVTVTAAELQARVADLLEKDRAGVLGPAMSDVRRQLDGLVGQGFVARWGTRRLEEIPRYLAAVALRLDRLPADRRRDEQRMAVVESVGQPDEARRDAAMRRERPEESAAELRWMIEELRVSLWAQSLGTAVPVSAERIRRLFVTAPR